MSEIALDLLVALLRMTLFVGAAALIVHLVLALARSDSPRVHRVAWFLVLAQGWFWWRLPVTLKFHHIVVVRFTNFSVPLRGC